MSVLSPETHTEERVSPEWERSQAEGKTGPGVWGLGSNQGNASKSRMRHHLTPLSLAKISRHCDAKCWWVDGKADSAGALRHDLAVLCQKLHIGILYAPAVPLPAMQSVRESIWNALMHGRKILIHKEFFKTCRSVSVVMPRGQEAENTWDENRATS